MNKTITFANKILIKNKNFNLCSIKSIKKNLILF